MSQRVFILGGTGNVGRTLTGEILKRPENGDGIELGGIGTHEGLFVFRNHVKNGLKTALVSALEEGPEVFRESVRSHSDQVADKDGIYEGLIEQLQDGGIVVDSTALAHEILHLYASFADGSANVRHGGLITVNKNPLVICDPEVFEILAAQRAKFGFSGTVMAGTGAVLDEVLALRYTTAGIKSIEVSLSGILDDVARKLVILARAAGYNVSLDDVLAGLFIDKKFSKARRRNQKLRYVAKMTIDHLTDKPTFTVGLDSFGTENRVLIYTKDFEDGPRASIAGPGAGPLIAAQAVMRDIRKVQNDGP